MATLDTLAIARRLVDAGADQKLADAIAVTARETADVGDHVTPDQLKIAITELEARLTWRFAGALLAQTAALGAIMATLLRLFATP